MIGVWQAQNTEQWTARARCQNWDPEIFFADPRADSMEAKRVCAGCPVRRECLEYALRTDQRFGVWGALTELERRELIRDGRLRATPQNRPHRRRPGPPATVPCGTMTAYRRHLDRREMPCELCAQAQREHYRLVRCARGRRG